jgi:hypothetical protein
LHRLFKLFDSYQIGIEIHEQLMTKIVSCAVIETDKIRTGSRENELLFEADKLKDNILILLKQRKILV